MAAAAAAGALGGADVAVLVAYFALLAAVGLAVGRQQARQQRRAQEAEGPASISQTDSYFLAERSVAWWAVAASLFASNIGSEHFIGLAGSAARSGVAVGWYEVGAIPVILLTGFFFLPTYLNAAVQTTPDYLEARYSRYSRTLIVCVSLALYVFSKISATLFAGQLILVQLIHVDKIVAVVLLVVFTAVYTVLGGLEAVIYTEALQTVILLIGGIMVIFFSFGEVGGWSSLLDELSDLAEEGRIQDDFMHFMRPTSDPDNPWTGLVFGLFSIAPWYWGVDQVIVQRALAGRNIAHGQLGCVAAAMLKFLPFFIMVVPGLCARVLISRRIGPDEDAAFDFDLAYPWLVLNIIPKNFRGIIVASMLSSLMSALASVFNSSATLFSLNIWKQIFPDTPEHRLVLVGRITVVVMAVLSLLWLPVMHLLGDSLFLIMQQPPAYMAPPIFALFFWGMVSHRPNRRGGNWSLSLGIGFGAIRFVLVVVEHVHSGGDPVNLFGPITGINFLHFAFLSFWLTTALLFGLSWFFSHTVSYVAMGGVGGGDDWHSSKKSLLFRPSLYDELMARAATDSAPASPTRDCHGSPTWPRTEPTDRHPAVLELSEIRPEAASCPRTSFDHDPATAARQLRTTSSEHDELALTDIDLGRPLPGSHLDDPLSAQEEPTTAPTSSRGDLPRICGCCLATKRVVRALVLIIMVAWILQVIRFL